jgi:hypothetical protein
MEPKLRNTHNRNVLYDFSSKYVKEIERYKLAQNLEPQIKS